MTVTRSLREHHREDVRTTGARLASPAVAATPDLTARATRTVAAEPGVTPGMEAEWGLKSFFGRYASAFSAAELSVIAHCYAVPVLIVTDTEATTFSAHDEIAEGFRRVTTEYRAQGLFSVGFQIQGVKPLTSHLCEVSVRWAYHDAHRRPKFHDRYRYVLRRTSDEGPRIHTVIVLGGPTRDGA